MTVPELLAARAGRRTLAIVTAGLLLMSSALCLWAEDRTSTARDAKLIRQVQQLSVSQLDVALPPLAFEKWLHVEAGADADSIGRSTTVRSKLLSTAEPTFRCVSKLKPI